VEVFDHDMVNVAGAATLAIWKGLADSVGAKEFMVGAGTTRARRQTHGARTRAAPRVGLCPGAAKLTAPPRARFQTKIAAVLLAPTARCNNRN
jgi:hypothetical protein